MGVVKDTKGYASQSTSLPACLPACLVDKQYKEQSCHDSKVINAIDNEPVVPVSQYPSIPVRKCPPFWGTWLKQLLPQIVNRDLLSTEMPPKTFH